MAQRDEIRIIRVFLSSPEDCKPERVAASGVLDEMNRTIGGRKRVFFQLLRWEDLPPGLGSNPQAVIDQQLGTYDILIGVMWMRFGTPIPGGAGSGTEHEVQQAIESWSRIGEPRVMFYFKLDPPEDLSAIDPAQLANVQDFRARLQARALTQTFHGTSEFESKLRVHLHKLIEHRRERVASPRGIVEPPEADARPIITALGCRASPVPVNFGLREPDWQTIKFRKVLSIRGAVDYVAGKLRAATSVVDVCVRTEKTQEYGETLSSFLRATTSFLRGEGNRWRQILGCKYDKEYVQAISSAIKDAKPDAATFRCYRLHSDVPMINYMILRHESHVEVLFGWGQEKGVFWSDHQDVVELFSGFTGALMKCSDEINLLDFIEGLANPERQLSGLREFWFPHFRNSRRTTIVYTAPIAFRVFVQGRRYFIRDIDINDSEEACSPKALKRDLKKYGQWIKTDEKSGFEVSRAYVPGGEAFANAELKEYLSKCQDYLIRQEFIPKACDCDSRLFHDVSWHPRPEGKRCVLDDNLILLGNSRANFKARDLLRGFRYELDPYNIVIKQPSDEEREKLRGQDKDYVECNNGTNIRLKEDWSRRSMVLVTRGPSLSDGTVATSILANQGQGVYAVVRDFLAPSENGERWNSLVRTFSLPTKPLPREFQMVFDVRLADEEFLWDSCECILCYVNKT